MRRGKTDGGSDANLPGCLGRLFGLFRLGGATKTEPARDGEPFPFRLRDDFLSPAERSFYGVLVSVVGARAVVCPKVNVADLVYVARPNENTGARNRISQKHVDFVLCAPNTMKPLLAVELDDKSHARADRAARDGIVDAVFRAAGLPLLHVPARSAYAPAELATLIAPHLPGVVPGVITPSAAPTCLKCGVPMVVRTATRGERQGQSFIGCPNYPRCRETRPLA